MASQGWSMLQSWAGFKLLFSWSLFCGQIGQIVVSTGYENNKLIMDGDVPSAIPESQLCNDMNLIYDETISLDLYKLSG